MKSHCLEHYLARAGIDGSSAGRMRPDRPAQRQVLAWSARSEHESLAMALSMLGLRVRVFDNGEAPINARQLASLADIYDALVDPPLTPDALGAALKTGRNRFIVEADASPRMADQLGQLPTSRLTVLAAFREHRPWEQLCSSLSLPEPTHDWPSGAPRGWGIFRDRRSVPARAPAVRRRLASQLLDDSPWVLPSLAEWEPRNVTATRTPAEGDGTLLDNMETPSTWFRAMAETFPGNLATFSEEGIQHGKDGIRLTLSEGSGGLRPYKSGAFTSTRSFRHGRFAAEIQAARGPGIITGFFLHRESPRQEIDIEFPRDNPRHMLVNVYFNPGDDGTAMGYGYRGSPYRIELGFDASEDFHLYEIEWRPEAIVWSADGRAVHERLSWDPTPIPHLPMQLHGNLWPPRSKELAGTLDRNGLSTTATFRRLSIFEKPSDGETTSILPAYSDYAPAPASDNADRPAWTST